MELAQLVGLLELVGRPVSVVEASLLKLGCSFGVEVDDAGNASSFNVNLTVDGKSYDAQFSKGKVEVLDART